MWRCRRRAQPRRRCRQRRLRLSSRGRRRRAPCRCQPATRFSAALTGQPSLAPVGRASTKPPGLSAGAIGMGMPASDPVLLSHTGSAAVPTGPPTPGQSSAMGSAAGRGGSKGRSSRALLVGIARDSAGRTMKHTSERWVAAWVGRSCRCGSHDCVSLAAIRSTNAGLQVNEIVAV